MDLISSEMLKLCLTVILSVFVTQINCENLPVLIWGQKTLGLFPALSQLSGDEFVKLVKSHSTSETLTVVFVENSLSVENFSQCRLKTETCFANLQKIVTKINLSAVDSPVKALKASYDEKSQNNISISTNDDWSEKVDAVGSEKLLFVSLYSVESNEDFANHDELMAQFYNALESKRGNVLGVYTALRPSFVYSKSFNRKTRQVPEEKQNITQDVTNIDDKILIAFSNLKIFGKDHPMASLTFKLNETTIENVNHSIQLEIESGENKVGLEFQLTGGTWWINKFHLDGKRFYGDHPVSAYQDKSFGCINITATDGTNHFSFEDFQLQPAFGNATNLTRFSDSHNDCIGFFSPAIWGGLFVIIIFAMILSCGLTAIMDIKKMDRFDDPKGKIITINAQE